MRSFAARSLAMLPMASLAVAPMAAGQNPVDGAVQLTRESIETQRRVLVGGSLHLTDGEASAFWPIYDAYERELAPVREKTARVAAEFVAAGASVTDDKVQAMMADLMAADDQSLVLRRKYMKQMGRRLPARKLALYFQLERKFDAVIAYEYAQRVPLVR
jgi:hypothetical protein